MPCISTQTESGDVYFLEPDQILVYGTGGIELQLNQGHVERVEQVKLSQQAIKDVDTRGRRYLLSYDATFQRFKFEVLKGETVYVPEWMILVEQEQAA